MRKGKIVTAVEKINIIKVLFFYKIQFSIQKQVLFTCNHKLNEDFIKIRKIFKLIYNNKMKEIQIIKETFYQKNT